MFNTRPRASHGKIITLHFFHGVTLQYYYIINITTIKREKENCIRFWENTINVAVVVSKKI